MRRREPALAPRMAGPWSRAWAAPTARRAVCRYFRRERAHQPAERATLHGPEHRGLDVGGQLLHPRSHPRLQRPEAADSTAAVDEEAIATSVCLFCPTLTFSKLPAAPARLLSGDDLSPSSDARNRPEWVKNSELECRVTPNRESNRTSWGHGAPPASGVDRAGPHIYRALGQDGENGFFRMLFNSHNIY
jgi:hypothetical protein